MCTVEAESVTQLAMDTGLLECSSQHDKKRSSDLGDSASAKREIQRERERERA